MQKSFSLFKELSLNLRSIEQIDDCIKIGLGPTGKNGLVENLKGELKFLTNGSFLIKAMEFENFSANVILKVLEQSSIKTAKISGDGSTTTILIACDLLKNSLNFLANGYNPIFISNGLKKIGYFLIEKTLDFALPVSSSKDLIGVLKTSLGKRIPQELKNLLYDIAPKVSRDGLILIEENIAETNEIEIVQGIELDKGFASSYFVNDLKNFEVSYEKPYVLLAGDAITSINQIREIIDHIKSINRPLIIVAEDIKKDIISTLVLNNIQKKLKIAVVKYNTIKFLKTGILEDLSLLTHSNYFPSNLKETKKYFSIEDLGQAEKVIIQKEKTTFLISKYSKLLAKRRINELNRELLTSETEHERTICKTRIARLSGNIIKLKIGSSNKYQIEEERQKIENAIFTLRASLEEGIVPGGGVFYFLLSDELKNWSYLNLVGDEIFSSQIVRKSLFRPFEDLCKNTSMSSYILFEKLKELGYPFTFDFLEKQYIHAYKDKVLDSAKCVRGILWNSLSTISILLTSE